MGTVLCFFLLPEFWALWSRGISRETFSTPWAAPCLPPLLLQLLPRTTQLRNLTGLQGVCSDGGLGYPSVLQAGRAWLWG